MKYDPDKHHRRSIRLKGYDYSQAGLYFITICTKNRECIFGKIENGIMEINDYGKIANDEWLKTASIRENVELDEYVIMPNHIHGIIILVETNGKDTAGRGDETGVRAYGDTTQPTLSKVRAYSETPQPVSTSSFQSPSNNIGSIIRGFKSAVTKRINDFQNTPGSTVWQRNYYEHIIRNEKSYSRISEYIRTNPLKWQEDKYYA